MWLVAMAMNLPSSSSALNQRTPSATGTLGHGSVRRLDEAVLVDASVGRQRGDEADVRTFRRLDRADTTVVRGVNVAHLEARALAGQATRTESRQAALVSHLAERVGLVHELRQLRATEVLLDHRADGLGVDEVVRHQRVDLLRHTHALLDGARHAHQADAVLVSPSTRPPRVRDGCRGGRYRQPSLRPFLSVDQVTNRLENVFLGQDRHDRAAALFLRRTSR